MTEQKDRCIERDTKERERIKEALDRKNNKVLKAIEANNVNLSAGKIEFNIPKDLSAIDALNHVRGIVKDIFIRGGSHD